MTLTTSVTTSTPFLTANWSIPTGTPTTGRGPFCNSTATCLALWGDGTFTLEGLAVDRAGNIGTVVTHTFIVDSTPPTITITAPAVNAIHRAGVATITVTITDATSGISVAPTVTVDQLNDATNVQTATFVSCTLPGGTSFSGPTYPTTATCTYTYSVLASGGASGDNTALITATGNDRAGNPGANATQTILVDTLAPIVVNTAPTSGAITNGTPTLSVSSSDPAKNSYASGVNTVQFYTSPDDGSGTGAGGMTPGAPTGVLTYRGDVTPGGTTATTTYSITPALADGLYWFVGVATDVAGNVATSSYTAFFVDTGAPTINWTVVTGTLGQNGWYTSTVGVAFTCYDPLSGIGTAGCVSTGSNGASLGSTGPSNGGVAVTSIYSITTDTTTAGVTTSGTATDKGGNSTATTSAAIKRDTVRPVSYIRTVGNENPGHLGTFNAGDLTANLANITGDAFDASSGIEYVSITVVRNTDGWYWNPAGAGVWQASPATITTVVTFASPTSTWTTTSGAIAWPSGVGAVGGTTGWAPGTYTVKSYASDFAGLTELTPSVTPARCSASYQHEPHHVYGGRHGSYRRHRHGVLQRRAAEHLLGRRHLRSYDAGSANAHRKRPGRH